MKAKVLIVDDDSFVREFVGQVLSEKYTILFARNGDEAIEVAKAEQPGVIVLDIVMPGKNGIDTCFALRAAPETKNIPVLMLTALNEPEQRISAFSSGADDYMAKPFLPEELIARVEAKLRRSRDSSQNVSHQLQVGDLKIDFEELKVEIGGNPTDIGQIEFKILNCLIKNRGQLVERDTLNHFVWGNDIPSERALDPHITSLRKKLKESSGELKTVYGRGYSLVIRGSAA